MPYITLNGPECYFAGCDPSSHQSIVIMEDLKRDGVEFCSALRPQTFEQVARRVDAMAVYHAQTWDSPEFQSGGRWSDIGGRFEHFSIEFINRFFVPEIWAHYMAQTRGAASSVVFHDRGWMKAAIEHLAELYRHEPICMIHGDTHLGNLYIDEHGNPGFLDAQVSRVPWHHELSYHVICALDSADRARWEPALVERYLGALRAQGIETPGFDEAWLSYQRSSAWVLFVFLTNPSIYQPESVNTAYAARFSAAALNYNLKRIL